MLWWSSARGSRRRCRPCAPGISTPGSTWGGYAIPELRHLTGQADEIMLEAIGRIDLLPEIQYAHARMYKSTGISATTLRKLPFEVEV
ncbi:hypothetical protein AB1285_23020 [Microbacterium sp. NRRL B-14842]|uniref:hypothetical protein n=1 Tax=Microbacterium sp. NRRL B-14842 TaxID=3162881 RepID=UPI003D278174